MNKTILIVEDEFIVAEDLQLTLQHAGYTISGIADNVIDALKIVEEKKPSLVMLDIQLKGELSGIDLAKKLKEKNIAFVYLSANSNQNVLEAAKATEPYGFLVKPFRELDLLVMLDIAFYRHENSLEAKWQTELLLQKKLYNIQQSKDSSIQKLINIAKALQQHIPFDFIAVKYERKGMNDYSWIGFLRIGFDEYQTIGVKELSTISGVPQQDIQEILTQSLSEDDVLFYNDDNFFNLVSGNKMMGLLRKIFSFSSTLCFPAIKEHGNNFTMYFFRHHPAGFDQEKVNFLSRMHLPFISILNNVAEQNRNEIAESSNLSKWTAKNQKSGSFKGIIGRSSSLLHVLDLVAQVSPVDSSVLLLGESGTGKEKIAGAIHDLSPRKNRPFIKINCSALPPTLIESELFGHEKGAFTNAVGKRTGKFELADTGTIFLDEIGDMPIELQTKLLRVLQEKEIERIGGKQPVKVDVRIIAATNRNLQHEMANGRFRLDLYYRLNVFPITLPPLRERKDDIKALVEYFADHFTNKFNKSYHGISQQMLDHLQEYSFPGNIRELENIIEQSVILNDGSSPLAMHQQLQSVNIPSTEINSVKTIDDLKKHQRNTEAEYIASILKQTHGRIRGKNGAAELLNEKPTTLESRLLKLGIKKKDFQ